ASAAATSPGLWSARRAPTARSVRPAAGTATRRRTTSSTETLPTGSSKCRPSRHPSACRHVSAMNGRLDRRTDRPAPNYVTASRVGSAGYRQSTRTPVTGGRRHPRRSMRRAGNGPLRRPAPCLECSLSQFTPYPEACDTAVGVDVEADLLDRLLGGHGEGGAGVGLRGSVGGGGGARRTGR